MWLTILDMSSLVIPADAESMRCVAMPRTFVNVASR